MDVVGVVYGGRRGSGEKNIEEGEDGGAREMTTGDEK